MTQSVGVLLTLTSWVFWREAALLDDAAWSNCNEHGCCNHMAAAYIRQQPGCAVIQRVVDNIHLIPLKRIRGVWGLCKCRMEHPHSLFLHAKETSYQMLDSFLNKYTLVIYQ